jgi:ubiquinone/menaquinone biosynthesis C-methylase UbiE
VPDSVDLYNASYGNSAEATYCAVRRDTYGVDFGQTSWATTEEWATLPELLQLTAASRVVELGCGSGGCAVHLAETVGCHVMGLDVNAEGIRAATDRSLSRHQSERARFELTDAGRPLPMAGATFDAAYANDAMCHIPDRSAVLTEIRRVLEPGGRVLYSDALVVTGMVSNTELATRSSIGYYLFVPQGENERMLQRAGFDVERVIDTTAQAAGVARRWHDARAARQAALVALEGEAQFSGLQRFLDCVHTLTSERRLARYLYLGRA